MDHLESSQHTGSRPSSVLLYRLRLQAAVVQTLLDELDARSPLPGTEAHLLEQLFEEVDRLEDAARTARATVSRNVEAA